MHNEYRSDQKYIMDLFMLNSHNKRGCESCNQKFNLGDRVVLAWGAWPDKCTKLIHENDAVFDKKTKTYFERTYYHSIH